MVKTRIIDGVEFEVIWDGTKELIPDRPYKVEPTWIPPNRAYNKTGRYAKKKGDNHAKPPLDNSVDVVEDLFGRGTTDKKGQ